jgi:hypothetical protein
MTRKIALAQYLLAGGKLSIMNAYRHFGISNVSREVIRLIEKPFNVVLTRKRMEGKTKYGTRCEWFEYYLVSNRINDKGIKEMMEHLKKPSKKVCKMKAKS